MEDKLNYHLIGLRIKERRSKVNLTQEKIAEKIGASVQYISKIETAGSKMSLNCIVEIAKALETTVDHLLMDNVPAASMPNLLAEAKNLFGDCTPEETFIIIQTSKALKNSMRQKNLKPAET
jgi:transcriptional regulator with XRE-family HTH domain